MSTMNIGGCTIHYERMGEGPPLVLTPGGRYGMDVERELASRLRGSCEVILWDRRNTGASDVWFESARSEQEVWADDVAELLRRLELAPAHLAGGSAGCRVSVLTAIRHPEVVRGLELWMPSGGPLASQALGHKYHMPYILAAQTGGMRAVADTPFFAERITANEGNGDRILSFDVDDFVNVMTAWNSFFCYDEDMPIVGATEAQISTITTPTLIFEGNDERHTKEASDALHRLIPTSELTKCPWSGADWTDRRSSEEFFEVFYPRLAPRILDFVTSVESARIANSAQAPR